MRSGFAIATSALVVSLVVPAVAGTAPRQELSVDQILDRAIEVQRGNQDRGLDVAFDYELLSISEKLDDGGGVEETEERVYASRHVGDVPYERLVQKDGEALTPKEVEEEDEREADFRKKVESGDWEGSEDDDRIVFDRRLLSRYAIELDRIEALSGRDCFVLAYEPKSGDLPEERRIERVLNQSSGTMWIDAETFEVARVEFDLDEKVRLWLGIIGSISEMTGRFDRGPEAAGAWLPKSLHLYVRGRILFRGLHRRETIEWRRFTPRSTTDDRF